MKKFEIELTDEQFAQLKKRTEADDFELTNEEVIAECFIFPETRFMDSLDLSGKVEVRAKE